MRLKIHTYVLIRPIVLFNWIMENVSIDIGGLDSVLGTPTAQKLIKLLATWSTISFQDLIEKTHLSKSQVHTTLRNLRKHNIVNSPSRGFYTLLNHPFTNLLQEAYRVKLFEVINSEIYQIKQLLKIDKLDFAESRYFELINLYNPILQESFAPLLSSLSSRFIESLRPE